MQWVAFTIMPPLPQNPRLWLVFAGLCEIVYALAMPHTRSFTCLRPSTLAIAFIVLSM